MNSSLKLKPKLTIEDFLKVRSRTEEICESLRPEDVSIQPVDFVSPPKWHLAHSTWFFEQFVLVDTVENYKLFHKDYAYFFNSYYNTVGTRVLRAERGLMTRPSLSEILSYRQYVNEAIQQLLTSGISDELMQIIEIGLQHEQQHQELLLYDIKYIFGHQPSFPILDFKVELNPEQNEREWIDVPEGIYSIGYNGNDFCWDNELASHKVYLHNYSIASTLISNEEYLEFIEDDGYSNFNLWHADGWEFINSNNKKAPLYWYKKDNQWCNYHLNYGLSEIQLKEPVAHISLYEAFAFAQWKGLRLPTEFEWEVASKHIKYKELWEWTNSAYLPYPNYKKVEGALGEYNGKFMVNQMVLRGGSVATPPNHLRPTYRNFFQPEMRWLYSGIRLAK